jgi:hypothetical protein
LFAHFEKQVDDSRMAFSDHLYKICYCSDIGLGRSTIALLFGEKERFLGPIWRACTMKVLAAMLTRSPALLQELVVANGLDVSLLREARTSQFKELVQQSQLFPYQVAINRFLAWAFVDEPHLRRAVIKQFIGSMALARSWRDAVRGMRRLLLDVLNFYVGDEPRAEPASRLTFDEIATAMRDA